MGWRTVVQVLGLVALLAVALPAPVAFAQTPTVTAAPDYGQAGTSGSWTIQVSGYGFFPGRSDGRISFAGDTTTYPFTTNSDGFFGPVTITPARRGPSPDLSYPITAAQPNTCGFRAYCGASATTQFWSMDGTATDERTGRTDCAPAGTPFTVTVEGRGWDPDRAGYVGLYRDGSLVQDRLIRIPVDESGTWSVSGWKFDGQPAGDTYEWRLDDGSKRGITLPWTIPCPALATTTTTTTVTTVTTVVEEGTTTTTRVPAIGAAVTVEPELGPPGFVPQVRGTGFPPGPVVVRWEGGVGSAMVTAGGDGTFALGLLVMPNDRIGPRAVVATARRARGVRPVPRRGRHREAFGERRVPDHAPPPAPPALTAPDGRKMAPR